MSILGASCSVYRTWTYLDANGGSIVSSIDNAAIEEAYNAFMRLQLVWHKASSLNKAIVVMRDGKGELQSLFEWVDIRTDTLNSNKVDRKTVKELQGSMFTPNPHSGRQTVMLPEPIADLNLKMLEKSVGTITDGLSKGQGKALFTSLMSKLTVSQWLQQNVVHWNYNLAMSGDAGFVDRLKQFTRELAESRCDEVDIKGLLVFRYSLDKLIEREQPELFAKCLLHRHVPVSTLRIDKVLCEIKSRR